MATLTDKYRTVAQAAKEIDVSEQRVRQFLAERRFRGAMKFKTPGGRGQWFIPTEEVKRVAKEERPPGNPGKRKSG